MNNEHVALPASTQTQHAHRSRLSRLQQEISQGEWWLISNPFDVLYLTGIDVTESPEREAVLYLSASHSLLSHSPFIAPPEWFSATLSSIHFDKSIAHIFKQTAGATLRFDAHDIRTAEAEELRAYVNSSNGSVAFLDRSRIWKLRQIKSTHELALLDTANKHTHDVMAGVLAALKAGVSEIQLAIEAEKAMLDLGGKPAFPTIVAFGEHTALPHHRPTHKQLKNNMAVLIDLGVKQQQYCGDCTRSVWYGDKSDETYQSIKSVVDEAYAAAIRCCKAGKKIGEVDVAARGVVADAGFGAQFIHSTGHGVGLEIHEPPSVYQTTQDTLTKNMVVTIEPGIYIPDTFGYRFENIVVVT